MRPVTDEHKSAVRAAWLANNKDRVRAAARAWYAANKEKRRASIASRRAANIENERAAARAYYAANSEKVKEAARKHQASHPEKHRAAVKRWRKANREKVRAAKRARYARDAAVRQSVKEGLRSYRRANPEQSRLAKQRRRARLSGSRSLGITAAQWRALLTEFRGTCAYCKTARATTIDHVVPISKGGRDEIDNVLPACGSCNSSKNNKDLAVWLRRKGFSAPDKCRVSC